MREARRPIKVGDVVLVDECHENYRPMVKQIHGDGTATLLSVHLGIEWRAKLSRLRPAKDPPPKARSK